MSEYTFDYQLPKTETKIGIVIAREVRLDLAQPKLNARLNDLIELRKQKELTHDEDQLREGSRDILRNGKYRPTGRGKPASEYLLREAIAGQFPRINAMVDINNYISLKYMVPISLWDVELAKTKSYCFRLGKPGESYIFNATGQILDLEDLVCGVAIQNGTEQPIVTPVKDSLATKTTDQSRHVVYAVYYSMRKGSKAHLEALLAETQELLEEIQAVVVENLVLRKD